MRKLFRAVAALLAVTAIAGCASADYETDAESSDKAAVKIVTGSTVVASLVYDIAGDYADITSLVPNAVDAHTYEPLPSEMAALESADIVILADRELNTRITELVTSSLPSDATLVFLNESVLDEADYIYIDGYTRRGKNPHTWTNLRFAWYWVSEISNRLIELMPENEESLRANANALQREINTLHENILNTVLEIPADQRQLVVYHDAWEYFGREYGIEVVGSLQSVDYSEPTPAQLATIIDNIRNSNVKAFYGSEVFPSDVLSTISKETGARYISDLSDDALPANIGSRPYLYVELMANNFGLIMEGLR